MCVQITVDKQITVVNPDIYSEEDAGLHIGVAIGILCRRVLQKSAENFSHYLKDYDLSLQQIGALLKISEFDGISQNQLGRLLVMERANIHKMIVQLKERGLVESRKDPKDARKLVINLSDAGERLINEIEPLHKASSTKHISVLDGDEQRQLMKLLERLAGG